MASVDINDAAMREAFRRLTEAVDDLTPLTTEIGELLRQNVAEEFAGSFGPDGTPWKPLKSRDGRPLDDSGQLKRSFMVRAMARSVEVGTALPYAVLHQFGGKAGRNLAALIPARPFFPSTDLPAVWREDIENAMVRYVRMAIGE